MNYDNLIETISVIVNSENIYKKDLSLTYELPENELRKLDEELHSRINKFGTFEPKDYVEIYVQGIKVKVIKKEQ